MQAIPARKFQIVGKWPFLDCARNTGRDGMYPLSAPTSRKQAYFPVVCRIWLGAWTTCQPSPLFPNCAWKMADAHTQGDRRVPFDRHGWHPRRVTAPMIGRSLSRANTEQGWKHAFANAMSAPHMENYGRDRECDPQRTCKTFHMPTDMAPASTGTDSAPTHDTPSHISAYSLNGVATISVTT